MSETCVPHHRQLIQVYTGDVMSVQHVRRLCTEIENGRRNIHVDDRTGRSSTSRKNVTDFSETDDSLGICCRFHINETVEMAVREWLRLQEPYLYRVEFLKIRCHIRICVDVFGGCVVS
jgi:hypothetical protein